MYDYRCKDCEHLGHCMSMMQMPMMYMPMMNMPMMNMPMFEEDDDDNEDNEDLIRMYPKIYVRINPMVKHHCDIMESLHGTMYCPHKEEMDKICKEVYEKYEEHHKDDDDDDEDNDDSDDKRQIFGQGRRDTIQNLIRILFIRDLLGRRRRRRLHYR